jgi:hypothetical protein
MLREEAKQPGGKVVTKDTMLTCPHEAVGFILMWLERNKYITVFDSTYEEKLEEILSNCNYLSLDTLEKLSTNTLTWG